MSTTKNRPYHDTKVSVVKSRGAIDKLLHDHGIEELQWTISGDRSLLRFQFVHDDIPLTVRFLVDPERMGDEPRGDSRAAHLKREAKRLHRTLFWAVKSRIEVIEAGLETPLTVWLPAIESGSQTFAERVAGLGPKVLARANPFAGGVLALPEASRG